MKALVCGGRDFSDYALLDSALTERRKLYGIDCIVSGKQRGADALAHIWACKNGICSIQVEAQWDFYRKRAGPIRNGWMLTYVRPDVVFAFPGGDGTADMVKRALSSNITVEEIGYGLAA